MEGVHPESHMHNAFCNFSRRLKIDTALLALQWAVLSAGAAATYFLFLFLLDS